MDKSCFLLGLLVVGLFALTACGQDSSPEPTTTPVQAGLQIVLEADLSPNEALPEGSLQAAQQIIEQRLEGLEITGASVQIQGERRLWVELPGVEESDLVVETIQPVGLLELVDSGEIFLPAGTMVPTTYRSGSRETGATDLMTSTGDITDTGEVSPSTPVLETMFTGDDLKRVNLTQDPQTSEFQVVFEMQDEAAERFAQYTQAHVGQVLAILLDGVVISSPVIQSPIPDGRGAISGDFSFDEARSLAVQMKYGALPLPLKVIEVRTVP